MRRVLPSWMLCLTGLSSCGGTTPQPEVAEERALEGNDQSRCEFRGRPDREAQETSVPGTKVPNVRRVYGFVGADEDRRRVLLCREIDTNLDGIKDVVRTYGEQGEKLTELADANYDGRVDTWLYFANGRVHKAEFDRNRDGKPDEVRNYTGGRISRVQRDTNGDGKPDVFEVYADGRLDRIGVDVNHDGSVDRWDRDALREAEAAPDETASDEEGEPTAGEKGEPTAGEKGAADPGG